MNFADRLTRHAAEHPFQRALVRPAGLDPRDGRRLWSHLTFRELDARSDRAARGFRDRVGIQRGELVLMLVEPGFDFFVVGFGLYKLGAVPVLIDPGMGLAGFLNCVAQIKPTALVGVPKAMVLSRVKGRAFRSIEKRVTVGASTWFWGGETLPMVLLAEPSFENADCGAEEEAGILFTSGSTGPAKGVRYTHGMFCAQAESIASMVDIRPGEVDVPCFLPFAMFSLTLGQTVVLPDMDFSRPATAQPERVVEAVMAHGAHQLVGSPAVMKRLARWCPENGVTLPSLRRVLTFGAPIPLDLHRAFRELLAEGVQIHTPYGATESLPVASIASEAVLEGTGAATARGEGTCVGSPVDIGTVRIIPITDEAVPEWDESAVVASGQIGEICVKGPQVSSEYRGLPEANASSKIRDDEGFWHRMGDLGYLDDEGRLWFLGRKSHRVICSDGALVFPVALEGVFNTHPGVFRSAVVELEGEPVLVVELESGFDRDIEAALLELARAHEATGRVKRVFFHPGFPVDRRHNAKIHRLQLRDWVAER